MHEDMEFENRAVNSGEENAISKNGKGWLETSNNVTIAGYFVPIIKLL